MSKELIMLKTLFSGWKNINEQHALEYAKYKIKKITTCKNDEERLVIINDKFQGIKFILSQLK